MARQKEFDQDKALEKAMTLFWEKGYEATSIRDLVEYLGIGRRSLYDTFKSKHDLFIAALDRYHNRLIDALDSYEEVSDQSYIKSPENFASPKTIIRAIFENCVNQAIDDKQRMGCFLVNSAMDLAGQDDAVAALAKDAVQRFERKFHQLLYQAQQSGELNTERELQEIAQYLTNAFFGLRVLAKMNPDRQILMNVVNLTLSALD